MSLKLSRLYAVILFFLSISTIYAQEPDFAWVKRFGSPTIKASGGIIATDPAGNSYISAPLASFSPFNLDGIIIPAGNENVVGGYIAKYNAQGQIVWAKPTTGINMISDVNTDKIIIDLSGNIYIAGDYYSGLDSNINGFTLSVFDVNNQGVRNLFLAKLNPDGNVLWVRTATASQNYYAQNAYNDIHFDLDGNINMTGTFREFITFPPALSLVHDVSECAVFLTKYSSDGAVIFSRKLEGGVENPYESLISDSQQVKQDSYGNLYRWSNGEGNTGIKKLLRYNSLGDLTGSKTLEYSITAPINYPNQKGLFLPGFAVDLYGNIFLSGFFTGQQLTVEGSTFTRYGTTQTNYDGLVIKLSANDFSMEWVHQAAYNNSDVLSRLLTDGLGNVYVAGNEYTITERRMLIKKLNGSGAVQWQKTVQGVYSQTQPLGIIDPMSICQSSNGGNVWISGMFDKNVYFDATAHFICPSGSTNHWNGFLVQYGNCNTETPQITIPEITQICSGQTIELTTVFSNPELSYKWNTGATTETITVDRAGIYYVIAQENEECYGKSEEIWITELAAPEVQVTFEGGSFNATSQSATYQWINCEGQTPIEGETSLTFTPAQAGSYAVAVTNESGCTTISQCRTVTDEELSADKYITGKAFAIYPNPVKNILYLKTIEEVSDITIINMLGQKMLSGTNTQVDVSAIPAGTYMLIAKTNQGLLKGKFIKQ